MLREYPYFWQRLLIFSGEGISQHPQLPIKMIRHQLKLLVVDQLCATVYIYSVYNQIQVFGNSLAEKSWEIEWLGATHHHVLRLLEALRSNLPLHISSKLTN